ncbi:MAG TPA: short-chain dehydrogenase [Lachnospiraceae bacterium]|nr:short-chain dehydrogenase [Lachnospiraceae bacterium]
MERKKKIVIITGASSGLGQEFAFQLDRIFCNLDEIWLIARRKERLVELSKLLDIQAKIIAMDVTKEQDMLSFKKILETENVSVHMLINCAGYGLMGRFDAIDIEEQLGMVEVNCKALTRLTYDCIPYMCRNGRIIQLASSAAFVPQQNFAIYAASKSYVLSFSRALREELKGKGIWVTAVCPGPVETEFFETAEKYGSTLAVKKLAMVSPQKVVREALSDSYKRKAVSVCSFPMKAFRILTKTVPHGVILNFMGFFH